MYKSSKLSLALMTLAWATLVIGGFAWLTVYAHTAGPQGTHPHANPQVRQDGTADQYRLEMFAHPKCPCTLASIHQLSHVMSLCPGKVTSTVWMFCPSPDRPGWSQTDLWRSAEIIPGVKVQRDLQGRRAAQFGAITSGQVLLYDKADHLVFSGGITFARGHQGDNVGCDCVIGFIKGRPTGISEAPVFGCLIQNF